MASHNQIYTNSNICTLRRKQLLGSKLEGGLSMEVGETVASGQDDIGDVILTRLYRSRTMDTLGVVMLTVGLYKRCRVCSRDM